MAIKANKRAVWLKHYLNESSSVTFLNKKESARSAGYKGKDDQSLAEIGCQNSIKLNDDITRWLDEAGLSENALKLKLVSLLDAKETKFFQKDGEVITEKEVEALNVQRATLDMAFKATGLYAPEKVEGTLVVKRILHCGNRDTT